ncbi:non-ribosomal peptide synthetase [Streptomyces aurantiacus]|uniref:Putative Linear gramicidin synthase subunit D n=1 Tax=Streptomyces aurantiacus JA 4570 TaxID=1286094 RepID=S3ZHF1_9ACTN|nr:non-ribosomal peptide synthetase [Streptomyces aurantiacus]EPH43046.1 putative Linear gramicidin synthase subunit D [Streptomyces aurantiacus JA 4570]
MTVSHEGQAEREGDPVAGRRELLAERLAAGGTRICPASAAQRGLWLEDQLKPGRTDYTVVWPLRLTGRLDVAALRAALTALVARHEVLRTRFVGVDGEPVQVIDPPVTLECGLTDLTDAADDERDAHVRARVRAAGTRPFDLASGPLFLAELLRENERQHVLVLAAHHIVFDGWSWSVLLRDLSALYEDFRGGGRGDTLAPLPVQYGDYAAWEQELLSGEALDEDLTYWRAHLADAPETVELPTDFTVGPRGRSGAGARRPVSVPEVPASALAELCAREGATPFMGVLAAMGVVLGRYGATDDVVVSTLSANRAQLELEELIGSFVNTLPLRIDLSGAPTFRELLARCRTTALGAFAHQDLPFDRLVEELAPRRTAGATPYAQVALVLQNGPGEQQTLGGLGVESLSVETRTATFDLSIQLWPAGDGALDGFVEYASDLFDEPTALRFAGHVRRVLEQAATDPDLPIGAYALLTEDEHREALTAAGADTAPAPAACLHELVAAQAARTPDAIAVHCGEESLTYAELDRAADKLAARLRADGVGTEQLVGVCVRRSVRSVTALLGVLKAGAAYLPLEPDNPAERLAYVIADSGAATVVTQAGLRDRLPSDGFATVLLDDVLEAPAAPAPPPCGAGPDNLAYVIYTSGSTGLPKGVAVSHRAAVTRVHDPRFISLTEQDVMLHALALSFDVSVLEVFGALANGCRLAVLPGKAMPEHVGAFLVEHEVTVAWLTAALFHAVVDTAGDGLAGMRTLIAGGDQLSTSHVERALGLLDDSALLVNGYGPTEAAIFASTHTMRPRDGVEGRVPIGAPIAGTELYVLDTQFQLVPPGVAGELYIGGDCLARGYLGRQELTAERFLPNPFGTAGARLYRTGDLVRRRADGLLEFLGRTDHQVKVRGFRVELGEIEQVLRRHPAVGDAVVVAIADDRAEQTLVGYVEPAPGGAPRPGELIEHCRGTLPGYMVPAQLVVLDSLPLNPNGKVDRAALPDAGGVRPELNTGYVPARGPIEESVVSVWRDVLGLDRVGVHDNFFDLGGHSLLASRLLARIRRTFDRDLPLATFFAGPTVAELSTALGTSLTATPGTARPAPLPADRPDPLPASLGQRRLWFAHQLDPDSVDYTIVWPLRLLGTLDVAALRRAVAHVVARHEVLRTRFASVDGEPVQIIGPAGDFDCPLTDLRGLPKGERAAEVGARISAAAVRRFDLEAGGLFRAELLRVTDEEHVLLIRVHHIVFDGWSSSVLLRDLSALYEQFRTGDGRGGLPPLPVQYGDYTVWERNWLSGTVLTGQLDFWRGRLTGAPETTRLPADFVPDGPVRSGAGARYEVSFPAGPGTELAAFCARTGATPFMGLLAVLGVVLGRYGETEDVVVGTYSANRGQPELEELVGFFVNTLALRVDLSGNPGFRDLVARCRAVSLGAFAHQDVPFDRVVEELAPRRRAGETPYVRVALVMQNMPDEGGTLGDVRVESLPSDTRSATFDLALHVWPSPDGGLDGFVEYATDVFAERTAARFADHVRWVLEQALADPDRPVGELALLTPVEHHELITLAGGHGERFAADAPSTRFLRQAARTPDAAAFVVEGTTLTYADLERRSARLATRLRAAGAGPETPVGVCLPRGLDLPVAALAIWRAGGVYLPLDPGTPPTRMAHLLSDSGTNLVVTDTAGESLVPAEVRRLVLDVIAEDAADGTDHDVTLPPPADLDALAAVIYTSGSTGLPKGVAITARSLLNRIDWMASAARLGPGDTLCQKGSIGFVDGLWELLGGLLHGVPTVVATPEQGTDPRLLTGLLAEHGVTHLLVVPSLLHSLLEIPDLAGRLPALTRWVSSGEELPPSLARLFAERLPGRELRNLYGSSEAWDTLCQRVGDAPVPGRPVPVGDPISNTTAYVLDTELRPVPAGVTGDLYLAGACLARGYLGKPDLTAERFLPHPFDPEGGRIYRSGDRAVRRADGQIELAGRADLQLKIRGVRVEPAETERALAELPGVRQAVVTGWSRPGARDGAMELVAHVVPERDAPLDERALRAALTRVLPRHLVPTVFTVLDDLPLNASGKVDRAALPQPRPRTGAGAGTAATEHERALREIWANVLGIDTVGLHEDFFDLGGHSLLAIQLVDRIAESLGTRLDVHTVFEYPTVHTLGRLLSASPDPQEAPHV